MNLFNEKHYIKIEVKTLIYLTSEYYLYTIDDKHLKIFSKDSSDTQHLKHQYTFDLIKEDKK